MTDRLRLSDSNRRWWTLGAMCFALFMVMLDNTVTNVALPSIQRDFDASLSALEQQVERLELGEREVELAEHAEDLGRCGPVELHEQPAEELGYLLRRSNH